MSPEQVRSAAGPLGPATDVWAIGAVLYELLAGRPPYGREPDAELVDMLLARLESEPPDLHGLVPHLPIPITTTVMLALRRDPAERYQTAAEFAAALERAALRRPRPQTIANASIPIHPTTPQSRHRREPTLISDAA
jgi:serine/threonine-protein kinase